MSQLATSVLEGGSSVTHTPTPAHECPSCPDALAAARRSRAPVACDCGAEYVPPRPDPERLLQQLLSDAELLARWGPYYLGHSVDYDRTRRGPMELVDDRERDARDARQEQGRARARGLFLRLDALRADARRTQGAELVRVVAVIDYLVERCGSERTKGHRVGGEVTAPKLSRLVGEAFADAPTRQIARATPRPGSEGYVVVKAAAEQARMALERHGAELLRDAAWLWGER